jgi:hypothetical protein
MRIPKMVQVMARAEHARGIPPPPGLVYDETRQVYVEQDDEEEDVE